MSISVTITPEDAKNVHPAERQLFNIIRQINEQEPPHILHGRFNVSGDLGELLTELRKAEAEVGAAARRLMQIKSAITTVLVAK